MILCDVNVVVAAQRDDHPQHYVVRPWFEALMFERLVFGVVTGGGGRVASARPCPWELGGALAVTVAPVRGRKVITDPAG